MVYFLNTLYNSTTSKIGEHNQIEIITKICWYHGNLAMVIKPSMAQVKKNPNRYNIPNIIVRTCILYHQKTYHSTS